MIICIQDNLKLMDDLAVLRPTIFCSVPRLYNKIYAGQVITFLLTSVIILTNLPQIYSGMLNR